MAASNSFVRASELQPIIRYCPLCDNATVFEYDQLQADAGCSGRMAVYRCNCGFPRSVGITEK